MTRGDGSVASVRPHLPPATWLLGLAALAGLIAPVHAATATSTDAAATATSTQPVAAATPTSTAPRLTGTFDGIVFEYSPGQEPLARLLAPRFAAHNREERLRAAAPAASTAPVPLSVEDLHANRARYLGHIATLLALNAPTALQTECYDEFLRNYAATMALHEAWHTMARELAIVRRVTLWDRAELIRQFDARHPVKGFAWDPVKKQGTVTFGFHRNSKDARFAALAALAAERRQLHRAYQLRIAPGKGNGVNYSARVSPLAAGHSDAKPAAAKPSPKEKPVEQTDWFPVIIPAALAGKPAAEQAAALWASGAQIVDILKDVDAMRQSTSLCDPTLAFLVLHETTELGIVDRYMHGPDRRWFCDGVANYVAWRVIRDLDGAAAAKSAYDLPEQLARYASLRTEADLRRWPAVENESEADQESELNSARYAYATNAVALMNARAGEDILPRLFAEIGKTKPEDTSILTVAAAWRKLTGTPLMSIVTAAIGETPKPGQPAPDDSQLEVIRAPKPMTLYAGFECLIYSSRKSGRVRQVKVHRVVPGGLAARTGLREGDRIVAIDGHPLAGLLVREARQSLNFEIPPDRPTTVRVSIERGLFRKKLELRLTFDPPGARP